MTDTATSPLLYRLDGPVCTLTLNRPAARNALSDGLLGALQAGLDRALARSDYADAAARVLADGATRAQVYDLAGDTGFTQDQLAGLIAAASGKPVVYKDLPEEEYRKLLESLGLPRPLAHILADSSAKAKNGALFDGSRTLCRLIGRPTTPIATSVREAFAK